MNSFFTLIKSEYLQRTRSYAFIITLCFSVAIGYTFVPEPNATYSTIQIANYIGYYNSAWFGYVTAMMASLFLSLVGFYLINNSIGIAIKTKVGQIVATTKISNFTYLVSKVFSNFLVLLTILLVIFIMSIILFFLYNDGYPFELFQFVKPYTLITIPSLFIISVLAMTFEVFLGKYSALQNIAFFCLFSLLLSTSKNSNELFLTDIFGSAIVLNQLEKEVGQKIQSTEKLSANIGFVFKNEKLTTNKFEFNGIDFPLLFIMSRILLFSIGIGIIYVSSLFFHRFNVKEKIKQKKEVLISEKITQDISISKLPKTNTNYGIYSLLKTELILLCKKGKKWSWIFNISGMIAFVFVPLNTAHQIILPILWFLQVGRLSELTTKEVTNKVHYFTFTSYKPIARVLTSQIIAALVLILFLALPLLIRLSIAINYFAVVSIILGALFIVLFAAFLGILTRNKKLFEVLFFFITYANMNRIPFTDYFGALTNDYSYLLNLGSSSLFLLTASFLIRNRQLQNAD